MDNGIPGDTSARHIIQVQKIPIAPFISAIQRQANYSTISCQHVISNLCDESLGHRLAFVRPLH